MECLKPYGEGMGWEKTINGVLEPIWTIGPLLPLSLIDVLVEKGQGSENQTHEESESEQDGDDFDIDGIDFDHSDDDDDDIINSLYLPYWTMFCLI